MDQLTLTAQATALAATAGTFLSLFQERVFGKALDGRPAFVLTVLLALACGVAAAARLGGTTITAPTSDVFGFSAEALKTAAAILIASQAAFQILTKPVTTTAAAN